MVNTGNTSEDAKKVYALIKRKRGWGYKTRPADFYAKMDSDPAFRKEIYEEVKQIDPIYNVPFDKFENLLKKKEAPVPAKPITFLKLYQTHLHRRLRTLGKTFGLTQH